MAFLVVMAAAVVVGAAYGIDRLAVVVHKFYVEHHHSPPRATGVTKTATSTTTTSVPGPARCQGLQLSAVVSDWRETTGTVEETVSFSNISASPCTIGGYPRLGAGAQNGTPLPAPNADLASLTSPTAAGSTAAPAPVTLARGARASFELAFANTCDSVLQPGEATTGGPNQCYAGVWLEVTPPQGTSPLLVTQPVRLTYATAGFQVGPIQAGDGPPLSGQPPPTSPTTSSSLP